MAWVPPDDHPSELEQDYENWPVESEREDRYVGIAQGGAPVVYDPEARMLQRARAEEEREQLVPEGEPEWVLEAEETLGEAIERVGKEVGWESLSAFAREHIEPERDEES